MHKKRFIVMAIGSHSFIRSRRHSTTVLFSGNGIRSFPIGHLSGEIALRSIRAAANWFSHSWENNTIHKYMRCKTR